MLNRYLPVHYTTLNRHLPDPLTGHKRPLTDTYLLLYSTLSNVDDILSITMLKYITLFVFPACSIVEGCGVVVRYLPCIFGEFHSLLSSQRNKIVDECIFANFCKCKQGGYLEFWWTTCYCYQGAVIFRLNNVKVKMSLKDVALISGLNCCLPCPSTMPERR